MKAPWLVATAGCGAALAVACIKGASPTAPPVVLNVPPVEAGVVTSPVEAGAATSAVSAIPSATSRSSPVCADHCTGRGTQELITFALAQAREVTPCYNHALAIDATLRGKMRVQVTLDEEGAVCRTHLVKSDLPDNMNNCVMHVLEQAKYPAPVGGCLDMVVPLAFEPRDAGTPSP